MATAAGGARALGGTPSVELDVVVGDYRVGWISEQRIGFGGFADRDEAVHGAYVAHRAMVRRLAAAGRSAPMPPAAEALAIARPGGREIALADGKEIALVVRPGRDSPSGTDAFGFEIHVPEPMDELGLRAMAHRMYAALRSSGLAWTFRTATPWRAADAADAPSRSTDRSLAYADATTIERGGHHDDADRVHHRPRSFPIPHWTSGRRRRTDARTGHDGRGIR